MGPLQSRIDSQVLQCSTLQTQADTIRQQIAETQGNYDEINRQIGVQDQLIASKNNEIARYNAQISDLPSQLVSIRNALNNAESMLQRQYYVCNTASQSLRNAQSDLEAARLKL